MSARRMASTVAPRLNVPQTQPADPRQRRNNDGRGYAFVLDGWKRLERFLILGLDGGTFYVEAKALTTENAGVVARCAAADPARTATMIRDVSVGGRAPRQSPAIFALAMLAAGGPRAAAHAYNVMPSVLRTGSHRLEFVAAVAELRGFGAGMRRALARTCFDGDAGQVAFQVTKYASRSGWSWRDVLRVVRPAPASPAHDALFRAVVTDADLLDLGGADAFGRRVVERMLPSGQKATPYDAVDPALLPAVYHAAWRARRSKDPAEVARLVAEHRLTHEMVSNDVKDSPIVWEALAAHMPPEALLRNLGKLSAVGVLAPGSALAKDMPRRLAGERLQAARVHPYRVLVARLAYERGKGVLGSLEWQPVPSVVAALDDAFYTAFPAVVPTKKRIHVAVDVSGSMRGHDFRTGWGGCADVFDGTRDKDGNPAGFVRPIDAAIAQAMTFVRTEENADVGAFTDGYCRFPLHARMSLKEALSSVPNFDGRLQTDCAVPIVRAMNDRRQVDAFVVITDNESYAGDVHVHVALDRYRQTTGIPAKLVVVATAATEFSVADPTDAGSMDVVGFDAAAPAVVADFIRGQASA